VLFILTVVISVASCTRRKTGLVGDGNLEAGVDAGGNYSTE